MPIWMLPALLIVFGLILLVVIARHQQPKLNRQLVQKRWSKVMAYAAEGEAGRQQALIEADKLVDFVLREYRVAGNSMAERMRSSEQLIPNYQQLWDAHKLRNKVAHESDVTLSTKQIKQALRSYQQTLKGLKAL